jgi:hypothetical protein
MNPRLLSDFSCDRAPFQLFHFNGADLANYAKLAGPTRGCEVELG